MDNDKSDAVQGLDDSQIRLFVGKNADYYLQKWKASEDPNKSAGWNWSSCLGGFFWLGYRKMYFHALIIAGLSLIINLIETFTAISLRQSINIGVLILLGACGNNWYYKHVNKKIANIKSKYSTIESQEAEMVKMGNVSWVGVGIVLIINVIGCVAAGLIEEIFVNPSL